ncbi:MAG: trimeric intracellular cation channel family protein [Bryobacteraceae bacterium]|nr:trimeric intracellular cation channel family protein [Bryobacteraceae bacterium]
MTPIAIEETLKPLVQTLDAVGTFVFALSGAATGVRARLDLFGVLVLSFAAATSGGILRDLLIGAVPPAAIRDWSYVAISIVAGLTTFLFHPKVDRLRTPILVFDAAGLSLFAVSGSQKSLALGMDPVPAMLLGMLTGIGGGIVRDVLANEIPLILRAELYAVAALAGAAVVVAGDVYGIPPLGPAIGGALLCFTIRMLAIRRGWGLPVATPEEDRARTD